MPMRFLGGLSRAELASLKDRFIPVTRAATLQGFGNHVGALINAPGDYALIEWGPTNVSGNLVAAYLIINGVIPLNAMQFNLNMDWGSPSLGEFYNAHTYAGVRTVDTLAQRLTIHSFIAALGGNLGPGDILGIRIDYNAGSGPDATNLHVLGAYVQWA